MEAQAGHCEICGGSNRNGSLSSDHNHGTGRFRGLICSNCNTILALAREDPMVLVSAMAYLERNAA